MVVGRRPKGALDGCSSDRPRQFERLFDGQPSAELDNRSSEIGMLRLERGPVDRALRQHHQLIPLEQRRVLGHVGGHHCDKPALQLFAYAVII